MITVKSKGRTMQHSISLTGKEEIVKKKINGSLREKPKTYFTIKLITDYGVEINTDGYFCYPSEGYRKPDGAFTANKWDLYELYKK